MTLTVLRRLEVTAAAYSGEEVAGIVLGALTVFLFTFFAICFVVLRSKNGANCRPGLTVTSASSGSALGGSAANGGGTGNQQHFSNGSSQTGLSAMKGGGTPANHINNANNNNNSNGNGKCMGAANGRLLNGSAQISPGGVCNGDGTFRRLSSTSIDTKDSKMSSSNLLISSSGGSVSNSTTNTNTNSGSTLSRSYVGLLPATGPEEQRKGGLTIRTNQLAEQIELCNYGMQPTTKDNLPTVNQTLYGEEQEHHSVMYGSQNVPSPGSSFGSPMYIGGSQQGHYLEESGNFKSAPMLNDNMTAAMMASSQVSPYTANHLYGGRYYPSGNSATCSSKASPSHHQATHHYLASVPATHYPLHSLASNHSSLSSLDHYHAHASSSGPQRRGGQSPSPVHHYAPPLHPLKPLSSLASNNNNHNYYKQTDYSDHGSFHDDLMVGAGSHLESQEQLEQFSKRRAATSVAEELQQRMAAAGVNCTGASTVGKVADEQLSINNLGGGQVAVNSNNGHVVQFANSATVYSYSPSGHGEVSISAKEANGPKPALNRVRSMTVNGQVMMAVAMAMDARDSPDEGLGEDETDAFES